MARFSKRRHGRKVNGILILDKPKGISSNDALQQVKHLYAAQKAGHTGSLDPMATGVLPICFGEATKFCKYLLEADKKYLATIKLGVKTASGDVEGDILETRALPTDLGKDTINRVIEQCTGTIAQLPSMYSALKHQGQPLYKLARQGITVERKVRQIQIYSIELLGFDGNDEIEIAVHCSKGTYIRTLAEDIGEMLGCGAHLIALRRTQSGPYVINNSKTLEQLAEIREIGGHSALDKSIVPIESALDKLPEVNIPVHMVEQVQQGRAILLPGPVTKGMVRLFRSTGDFLGVGEVLDDGHIQPRRLLVTTQI